MYGKSRAVAVTFATAGLIGLCAPAALASTSGDRGGDNGGLIGAVNIGSGNTDNTCAHSHVQASDSDDLGLPLDLIRNTCGNSGRVCTAVFGSSV